jgi:phage terminase large subunit-like protein
MRSQRLASLTEYDSEILAHDWRFWGRPKQLIPGTEGAALQRTDWRYWLNLGGRGQGKTRTGAETIRVWSKSHNYCNLIGATVDDARDIMILGESGIMAVCPRAERPVYIQQLRRLRWPNGATSLIFTADEPERLRGKQHAKLWADELCAWRYPKEAWDQAKFGLRLKPSPQAIISTTPKPLPELRALLDDPATVVTRGSSYENRANLADQWFKDIVQSYEGTRIGRQELYAEILDDYEGALWTHAMIDKNRVERMVVPTIQRLVVGLDPSVSANDTSDEAGIVAVGMGQKNGAWHLYVFEDATLRGSPGEWGRAAIKLLIKWRGDRIIGEVNNGGDLVEANLRGIAPNVPFQKVHASRGKAIRAEPVAALYEQGRVHHVQGEDLSTLEEQMTQFVPGVTKKSPDRMDALVWACFALLIEPEQEQLIATDAGRFEISPY